MGAAALAAVPLQGGGPVGGGPVGGGPQEGASLGTTKEVLGTTKEVLGFYEGSPRIPGSTIKLSRISARILY